MSNTTTQTQFRRGTLEEHNSFIGAIAEVTVDTTNNTLRVHNGVLVGGNKVLTENELNPKFNTTTSLKIPIGNTLQQPSVEEGLIRFNSETVNFEFCNGIEWAPLSVEVNLGIEYDEITGLTITNNAGNDVIIPNASETDYGIVSISNQSFKGNKTFLDSINTSSLFVNSNTLFIDSSSNKVGIKTSTPTHDLEVNGTFTAVSKSFLIDHPSKKNKKLQYGSVESPYHGIRLTGKNKVINGYCKVKLPDYIKDLVHDLDVNIQITNYRHSEIIYINDIDIQNSEFEVKTNIKTINILSFFWTFTAIRKDIEKLIVEY